MLVCALLAVSCTPLPSDGEEAEVEEVTLDSAALEAGQEAAALAQLVDALESMELASSRVRSGLQRPDAQPGLLESDFSDLVGDQFEAARLAELLLLMAISTPDDSPARGAATDGLAALATSLYLAAIDSAQLYNNLKSGLDSLTDALIVLEAQHQATAASPQGGVVLLPAGLESPQLSLSLVDAPSRPVIQPAVGFGTMAAASELEWLEEYSNSPSAADIEAVTAAASTRVALMGGLNTIAPASPFASYALRAPATSVRYQSQLEQTATLANDGDDLLVLALSDVQGVEALLLKLPRDDASLEIAARSSLEADGEPLPGIGRPDARLVAGAGGYRVSVFLESVNRARVEFAVTCTVPLLGARATTTADASATAGTLELSMPTVLALTQITALEEEPQIVCVDTFGTVESGRIALDDVTTAVAGD
jgi:hypothetical protein